MVLQDTKELDLDNMERLGQFIQLRGTTSLLAVMFRKIFEKKK